VGTFCIGGRIENVTDRSRGASIAKFLVDTGSEFTWVPGTVLDKLGIEREKKDLEFTMATARG